MVAMLYLYLEISISLRGIQRTYETISEYYVSGCPPNFRETDSQWPK